MIGRGNPFISPNDVVHGLPRLHKRLTEATIQRNCLAAIKSMRWFASSFSNSTGFKRYPASEAEIGREETMVSISSSASAIGEKISINVWLDICNVKKVRTGILGWSLVLIHLDLQVHLGSELRECRLRRYLLVHRQVLPLRP